MLINRNSLQAVLTGLKKNFDIGLEDTNLPIVWPMIATRIPSTTREEEYAWLEGFPTMREWIGEKEIANLKRRAYKIRNRPFEATISISRFDIEDDQISGYGEIMRMAGASARQHPDEQIIELLNNGFSATKGKAYTGKAFFATDHKIGGKDFSNKGTKALTSATLAGARGSVGAGRTSMRKAFAASGRKINVAPSILWCGPALEDHADTLYGSDRLEDGKTNPYKGKFKPVVDARIESDTAWGLLDVMKPVKPLIFQEREAPHVESEDMHSEAAFRRAEYLVSAEARCGYGYGFPQLAYGSDGTT